MFIFVLDRIRSFNRHIHSIVNILPLRNNTYIIGLIIAPYVLNSAQVSQQNCFSQKTKTKSGLFGPNVHTSLNLLIWGCVFRASVRTARRTAFLFDGILTPPKYLYDQMRDYFTKGGPRMAAERHPGLYVNKVNNGGAPVTAGC